MGSQREIAVELCGGILKVTVDGEVKLVVKRLAWKFRGNERLVIENCYDFNYVLISRNSSSNDDDDGGGGSERSNHRLLK